MLDVALSVSRATIKGALLIGVIQGTLAGIGFAVAGIEAAVFWGAIMAVLSILPGIGAPLVWVPAVIYLLMSGQVVAGIGLLVWSAGVVGSIDNFLRPVLVGRDTKMPDEARLPRSCRQADQGMSPAGTDIGWRDRHALSPYVTSTGLEVARRAGEAPCFRSPACY